MPRKTFTLISSLTTVLCGAAVAIVTYIGAGPIEAITGSIAVAEGAIITICSKFVKD